MDIDELKDRMKQINDKYLLDFEKCHYELDNLLLEFIENKEVNDLFWQIEKWHS